MIAEGDNGEKKRKQRGRLSVEGKRRTRTKGENLEIVRRRKQRASVWREEKRKRGAAE